MLRKTIQLLNEKHSHNLKRESSPKNENVLTLVSFQTHLTYFLQWNTKGDILNFILFALLSLIAVNENWSFQAGQTHRKISVHTVRILVH